MRTVRTWKIVIPVVILIVLGGWFAVRSSTNPAKRAQGELIPTAQVERGDLRLDVYAIGDLQTTRTAPLSAPPASGGTLSILLLTSSGTQVEPGEVVLQFDLSEQEYNLQKNRSDLEEAEQEIAQAKAQTALQEADDRLALLKAKFGVRQAELDVQKNPLLAAIDAKKNELALEEARRALAQLEQDIRSHASSNQSALQLAQTKMNKARLEMQRAERNIQNMTLRAPMAGVVVAQPNMMAMGGFFFTGMSVPEYRAGDQVQPGSHVADILDMSRMEIVAKVGEMDRPSVRVGEPVEIRVDAIPDSVFRGKVKAVSGMAVSSMFTANPTRRFDVTVELDHPSPLLRSGFSAHLTMIGEEVKGALSIPRVAIFEREGKPVVYVKQGGEFQPHSVQVKNQTAACAVVEGLPIGTEVALVNPTATAQSAETAKSPAGPAVQGGK